MLSVFLLIGSIGVIKSPNKKIDMVNLEDISQPFNIQKLNSSWGLPSSSSLLYGFTVLPSSNIQDGNEQGKKPKLKQTPNIS